MNILTQITSDHHHSALVNQLRTIAEKDFWKMIYQVTIAIVILIGYGCAGNNGEGKGVLGQGRGDRVSGRTVRRSGTLVGPGDRYDDGPIYPPKPNEFYYEANDGRGNIHYRGEYTDLSGAVRGYYGYNNARGLYRIVRYIADARGFRANITTNEPGTDDRENPASVNIWVNKHIEFDQDQLTKAGGGGRRDGVDGVAGYVGSR